MAEAEEEKTPLQQKLDEFSEQLSKVDIYLRNLKPEYDAFVYFLRSSQLFV